MEDLLNKLIAQMETCRAHAFDIKYKLGDVDGVANALAFLQALKGTLNLDAAIDKAMGALKDQAEIWAPLKNEIETAIMARSSTLRVGGCIYDNPDTRNKERTESPRGIILIDSILFINGHSSMVVVSGVKTFLEHPEAPQVFKCKHTHIDEDGTVRFEEKIRVPHVQNEAGAVDIDVTAERIILKANEAAEPYRASWEEVHNELYGAE